MRRGTPPTEPSKIIHKRWSVPRRPSPRHGTDHGSASIWLLGVGLAITVLGAAMGAITGVVASRHHAQTAADLAALAGAAHAYTGETDACRWAERAAVANNARLESCQVTGLDIHVSVSVELPTPVQRFGRAEAVARAGPVRFSS